MTALTGSVKQRPKALPDTRPEKNRTKMWLVVPAIMMSSLKQLVRTRAQRLSTRGFLAAVLSVCSHAALLGGEATVPADPSSSSPISVHESRLKFTTTAEGVYRVTHEQLAPYLEQMGDPRHWSLWCVGRQIPIMVHGQENGRFDPGDYVEWYAEPLRTPYNRVAHGSFDAATEVTVRDAYTTQGAYFLLFAAQPEQPPLRIRDVPTTVPLKKRFWENRTFRRFRHFEENSIRRNFRPDAGAEYTDNKFWDHFSWPSLPWRHHFRNLVGLDPNSDQPCSITIKLWGLNRPRNPPQHQVRIAIKDTTIGYARWPGAREFYFTTSTLPATIFKEWATEFVFEVQPQVSPDAPDVVLLDWIEVSYPGVYRAEDNWLEFIGPPLPNNLEPPYNGWLNPLSLETFTQQPVWILDLTAAERQQPPIGRAWAYKGQEYYNVFLPIAKTGHRYAAYSPGAVRTPAAVRWVEPDRLRAPTQGADYLLITHEKFVSAAQRLAEHRTRLGLKSLVVTTEEIADSFHQGFTNIVGIKEFMRYACDNWKPRPRFVLLLGDASWEDQAVGESQFANYLPAYYHKSPAMGFYASDNWFACVEGGDEYPDLAVGRLPARTLDEAQGYVYKVIEYDTRPAEGDWRRSALLLSSFNAESHRELDSTAEKHLAGMEITRLYTNEALTRSTDLASSVTRCFDRGHAVVIFAGHGGSFVWQVGGNVGGQEAPALFSPDHVAQLTNWRRYPLVVALTCYTNAFDNPLKQTIGESLILEPGRGAIAVVSASWRGILQNEFPLANALLAEFRRNPAATVGEALVAAKRAVRDGDVIHGVCLLGDPALRIYFDSRASNVPPR